ncbi:MAG TPA: GNAT family N-acetyltransferase [Terracidiphilus sp.]|jgi:GNAT superfamily N-acetyltransferase
MVSIRPANDSDAGAIAHVHVESWRTTYTGIVPDAYLAGLDEILRAKLWHEWLAGRALVLVAERGGQMVGFAHGGANREVLEECDAELYSIYLLREAQRHGAGTALLRAIASALRERGFRSMAVWVLERNPARGFYEQMGAHLAASKVIEIGGAKLLEVGYVWPELRNLVEAT